MAEKRAIDILDQILTSPESEREVILSAECGDDRLLREEILSLLKSHARASDFLSIPLMDLSSLLREMAPAESAGQRVGQYELISRIGEGSYGVVWLAVQHEPINREVALKILKPGFDVASVAARFDAERDALAKLEHPNISRIYDAGIHSSGRPYFVMELVRGKSITDYARCQNLTTSQIVQLLIESAQAVQYAHEQGVIHRDLKPQNLLVVEMNQRAVPKVIDFGIAKAITPQRNAVETLAAFPMGSPAYMSAEQLYAAGEVDARTDVYSLGVILNELLIRKLPSAIGSDAEKAVELAACKVPNSLTAIILKATAADRLARYATATQFAEDLQRFLDHQPVQARWRSKPRRNPVWVAAAVLVLGVVVFVGYKVWHHRPNRETGREESIVRTPIDAPMPALQTLEEVWKAPVQTPGGWWTIDIDPLHRRIFATGHSDELMVVDLDSGAMIRRFSPDGRKVVRACLSGDALRVGVFTRGADPADTLLLVLNSSDLQEIARVAVRGPVVSGCFVDRLGTQIACSVEAKDGAVEFYDIGTGRKLSASQPLLPGAVSWSIKSAGDDLSVVTFDHGTRAVRLDSNSGRVIQTYEGLDGGGERVDVDPAFHRVLISGRAEVVRAYDLDSGELTGIYGGMNLVSCDAAMSPDGRTLFSGTDQNRLQAHDIASGKLLWRATGEIKDAFAPKFLASEGKVVLCSHDGTLRLWKLPSNR